MTELIEMIELTDELYTASAYDWHHVPYTVNHHKWWLQWYRLNDARFFFSFVSPQKRRYSFFVDGVRVLDASVARANGEKIAWYWSWDDKEDLEALVRLTPAHVLDRLSLLLDAIG